MFRDQEPTELQVAASFYSNTTLFIDSLGLSSVTPSYCVFERNAPRKRGTSIGALIWAFGRLKTTGVSAQAILGIPFEACARIAQSDKASKSVCHDGIRCRSEAELVDRRCPRSLPSAGLGEIDGHPGYRHHRIWNQLIQRVAMPIGVQSGRLFTTQANRSDCPTCKAFAFTSIA
jgi:hypothetical protein